MKNTTTLQHIKIAADTLNYQGGMVQLDADSKAFGPWAAEELPAFKAYAKLVDLVDTAKHHAIMCNVASMRVAGFVY